LCNFDHNLDGGSLWGGDLRWRHQGNKAVNAVFADGHAETRAHGTLFEGNFFPAMWSTR
jgi:prepilin-type processing-associated H-X9-DG protein